MKLAFTPLLDLGLDRFKTSIATHRFATVRSSGIFIANSSVSSCKRSGIAWKNMIFHKKPKLSVKPFELAKILTASVFPNLEKYSWNHIIRQFLNWRDRSSIYKILREITRKSKILIRVFLTTWKTSVKPFHLFIFSLTKDFHVF